MYDVGGTRNSVSSLILSMISLMYPIMISAPHGRHTSMTVRSQDNDSDRVLDQTFFLSVAAIIFLA